MIPLSRPGYFGKKCECDSSTIGSGENHKEECLPPDSGEICNGNGKCKCGKCECDRDHVGEFCACDESDCPRYEFSI